MRLCTIHCCVCHVKTSLEEQKSSERASTKRWIAQAPEVLLNKRQFLEDISRPQRACSRTFSFGSWFTAMLKILHLCWPPLSLGGPSLSLLEFVIIVFNVSCFKFLNFKKLTRKSSMIPQDLVETQFRGSKICVVITTPHILEVKLSISVNDLSQLAQGFWVSFCQTYGFILSLLYTKIM